MSELVKSDESPLNFEDFKNENGITYWWASHLMLMLGYKEMTSFKKAIDRAMKACISLNIDCLDNFIKEKNNDLEDYKLTRFACYLTVMNADPKRKEVAAAQVYFVEQTRKFEIIIQKADEIERLTIRDEIKEGNKSLNSTATKAGLSDYARFANAGYMGLYNMPNWELAKRRNVEKKDLHEYMGRTELAANLFKLTQTEERIKNYNIKGQQGLEETHYKVGREVRDIIQKNSGKSPEELPMERKLPDVRKELKAGYKKMQELDSKKPKKKKP
jgi:DNA-damage-inducible protein D